MFSVLTINCAFGQQQNIEFGNPPKRLRQVLRDGKKSVKETLVLLQGGT